MYLTFFGEVCFLLLHLVRFRRWVRLMILGQATIEALETPRIQAMRKNVKSNQPKNVRRTPLDSRRNYVKRTGACQTPFDRKSENLNFKLQLIR